MSKIVTRTGKGSLISLSEDNDHKESTAGLVVTTATLLTVDIDNQNDTIEVTGNVAITLDTRANITAVLHTSDYKVKVVALHASGCTVLCGGSDTYSDSTTVKTLAQYEWIEIQSSSVSGKWNITNSSNVFKISGITLSQLLRSDVAGSAQGVVNFVNSIKFAGTLITTSAADINNLATKDDLNDLIVGGDGLVDGSITTAKLAPDAVTSAKLADNAVGSEHLQDNSVGNSELQTSSVTQSKLAGNSVGTDEIINSSVTATEIADFSITASELATDSVTAVKIQDFTITPSELATNSVTAVKIQAGAVDATKFSSTAVSDEIIGFSVGAIGTYAMMRDFSNTGKGVGGTESGANLRYSNADGVTDAAVPSGTWRLMGFSAGTSNAGEVSMYLRVS